MGNHHTVIVLQNHPDEKKFLQIGSLTLPQHMLLAQIEMSLLAGYVLLAALPTDILCSPTGTISPLSQSVLYILNAPITGSMNPSR